MVRPLASLVLVLALAAPAAGRAAPEPWRPVAGAGAAAAAVRAARGDAVTEAVEPGPAAPDGGGPPPAADPRPAVFTDGERAPRGERRAEGAAAARAGR